MARGNGESAQDWLSRADEELATARAAVEREDERIGVGAVLPGQPFPVLDEQHAAATDRLEAAEGEHLVALEAWLRER